MQGLPSDEQHTLRTSWIKHSDFIKSMEKKRRLEDKLVSFCGYMIFIVSVCVTCALAVHANERYQYTNSIERVFSREYFQDSAYEHHVLTFDALKTKNEYVSWFFDTVKNTVYLV